MEWLEALPAWDGKERLDTWLVDLCGAQDNPATRWPAHTCSEGRLPAHISRDSSLM